MRKTVIKGFWAWNFDKEEKWLNDMALKGLVLVSVGFCNYTFEECTPGEYNIRMELLENYHTHAESQQYIRFIEETGAEYLGSVIRWVYFRSKTENGEFNLYSDNASRIKHLNRLLSFLGIVSITNIGIGLANISNYIQNSVLALLIISILNLSFGIFVAFGFLRIHHKKIKLKKQQNLFE